MRVISVMTSAREETRHSTDDLDLGDLFKSFYRREYYHAVAVAGSLSPGQGSGRRPGPGVFGHRHWDRICR
jgi:hypothetical protein